MSGKGRRKVVKGLNQASKVKAEPRTRVITAPMIVLARRGAPMAMTDMGIKATGPGTLYLVPELGKNPKPGTYDVKVHAKSNEALWISSSVSMQIVVVESERTLTGALTGSWKTGDTLAMPPAGLTLSEGPENCRVVSPPGGVFLKAGQIPVVIEAPASGTSTSVRWEGVVTVAKGTPEITWTAPEPLVYGVEVGGPKLFAVIKPATLAFKYNPLGGTQPDRGPVTLTASRAADDDYVVATATINVTIVGKSGNHDNPLDLATVPNKKAGPDVGSMSTSELAKAFAKKTPDAVMNELNQIPGITATTRPGRSGKVTMLDVTDRRRYKDPQRLTAIEFHQGGGIHGNTPYVRVSTTQGKIKIVQPGYNPHGEKPIETIYIKGT